ncbi:MAG: T9SS type A sorting domain-containing protein [Bacteroidia bacterium]|nr:T9SS type A sorting domain-containing protein [Bacteroidia bacterium]
MLLRLFFLYSLCISTAFAQCPFGVSVNVQAATTCSPCNGTVTLSPVSGTPPYTYSWSVIGSTTSAVSGLCPGSYTVTVTDAVNCTVTDTINVQNDFMQITVSETSPVLCNGESNGSLTALVSGNGPFLYSWNPSGQTNAVAPGLGAGCYTVSVTDANGCSKTQSFCLFQPAPVNLTTVGNPDVCLSCGGDAGALAGGGTAPYAYLWSNNATGQTITGLCSGNYVITVTDNHGCTQSDTVSIAAGPGGPACSVSLLSAPSCSTCCDGILQANVIGGTLPVFLSWTPGGPTGVCPGLYTFTVTDANGCVCTDTITVGFLTGLAFPLMPSFLIRQEENSLLVMTARQESIPVFLYDLSGRELVSTHLNDGEGRLSTVTIQPGIFFLRILWEGESFSRKVIIR